MPKIVDHAARRARIVDAYLDLAGRKGVASMSSRALAGELGIANSLLWRYFSDMDELLAMAYRTVIANVDDRIMFAIHGLRSADAVRAMVGELLPLSDVAKAESRVVVSFWSLEVAKGMAIADGLHETEAWTSVLARLVAEAMAGATPETGASGTADGAAAKAADTAAIIMSLADTAQIDYAARGDDAAIAATVALIDRIIDAI